MMNIWKALFSREFVTEYYEGGHRIRHRIVNIITYIIATLGILAMLAIPSYIVYFLTVDHFPIWVIVLIAIPTYLFDIGLSLLLLYGISKSQIPE